MFGQGENVLIGTGFQITKKTLITILVCTCLSMFFMRNAFFSLFYLVPLGYAVIVTGLVWHTFFAAAITNIILVAGSFLINTGNSANLLTEVLYLTALFLGYIWIIGGSNIRTAYRFIISSAAGAVIFLFIVNRADSVFDILFMRMSEEFSSSIFSAEMLENVKNILLRGGAFISMCFLFFINRQLAISAARLMKKLPFTNLNIESNKAVADKKGLTSFFAPPNTIWIFCGALATVIMTRTIRIEILEIIAWNVFVICVIIFLVQGTGILLHILAGRTPAFKMTASIMIIVLFISPLGIIAVAALLLLGIIENWVPFRRQNNTQ